MHLLLFFFSVHLPFFFNKKKSICIFLWSKPSYQYHENIDPTEFYLGPPNSKSYAKSQLAQKANQILKTLHKKEEMRIPLLVSISRRYSLTFSPKEKVISIKEPQIFFHVRQNHVSSGSRETDLPEIWASMILVYFLIHFYLFSFLLSFLPSFFYSLVHSFLPAFIIDWLFFFFHLFICLIFLFLKRRKNIQTHYVIPTFYMLEVEFSFHLQVL